MKYYYLISSLPRLDIDSDSLSMDQLEESLELITRNLSDEDQVLMKCLLHEHDNQNLLSVLFHEYHDFEIRAIHQPSTIPFEVLGNYRREFSALPDYMMNYLNDFSGSFSSLTMREMEQNLDWYLLEYIQEIDNLFLNTYYSWAFGLKQTVAVVNQKSFDFLKTTNESSEPFFPATRALHGLTDQKEVANQLAPLVESRDIEGIESKIKECYWQFADCWQEPFSIEQVLAYVIKLKRRYDQKWLSPKGEVTSSGFEELVDEIKEKRPSAKIPMI